MVYGSCQGNGITTLRLCDRVDRGRGAGEVGVRQGQGLGVCQGFVGVGYSGSGGGHSPLSSG